MGRLRICPVLRALGDTGGGRRRRARRHSLLAGSNAEEALVPALDHLPLAQSEIKRRAPHGAVELRAVLVQRACGILSARNERVSKRGAGEKASAPSLPSLWQRGFRPPGWPRPAAARTRVLHGKLVALGRKDGARALGLVFHPDAEICVCVEVLTTLVLGQRHGEHREQEDQEAPHGEKLKLLTWHCPRET